MTDPAPNPKTSNLAIAALVVSLVGCLFPLASLVALGLAIGALVQIGKGAASGKGLAITALVLSLAIPGALIAIAVPNFIKFQSRAWLRTPTPSPT